MEQPIASPSSLRIEHELLELLETLSDNDITDVTLVVADASADNASLLMQQQSSNSESLDSRVNANDVPSRATPSLNRVDAPHAQQQHVTASAHSHASLARKRRVRPRQTAASRRSDPNKARNERKHELLYLHKQVHELETQLRALQQRTTRTPGLAHSSNISDSQRTRRHHPAAAAATATAAAAQVWQELIERQRALRAAAEKENIRLKLVLAAQRKATERLESLLLKPSAVRELTKCVQHTAGYPHYHRHGRCARQQAPLPVCVAPVPCAPLLSDAAVFDALLDGVAQAHASVDSVFASHGLAHTDAPRTDARVRRDAASGRVCMQISASHVLPFGRDAVRDVVWRHFVFGKEAIPCRYHTERAPKVFVPTTTSYLKVRVRVLLCDVRTCSLVICRSDGTSERCVHTPGRSLSESLSSADTPSLVPCSLVLIRTRVS